MSEIISGWQCPNCNSIWSPYLDHCPSCNITKESNLICRCPKDLIGHLSSCPMSWQHNRNVSCPCRKENGGSGVCGCILGGPQVTC